MRTDDFGRRVAFDTFRAGIPGRDYSIRVKVKDCIVNDTLDQLSKPLFRRSRLAPFRHIPRDFNEPEEFACLVADRINYRESPKLGAVLTDPPTFALEPPLFGSILQYGSWEPSLLVLRRKKAGKMLAKDFRFLIALQLSSARVPGYNETFGVKEKERVINDGVDQ